MNSGIYKIVNKLNGKCYVGSAKDFDKRWKRHFKDLEKGIHSSIKLQRSYDKHGKDSFECEIIELLEYTKDIIIERENYWIQALNSKNNGYNIADATFGDYLSNHPNREEIIQKISKTVKENISKMTDAERKDKWGLSGELNPMYGRNDHCHGLIRRGKEIKGKTYKEIFGDRSEEIIQRVKEGFTEDIRRRISESSKKRVGEKNSFYGKTHSEETRKSISEKNKGNIAVNRRKVCVDGIIYESLDQAGKESGVKGTTIYHRCYSKNIKYANTYFLDEPKNIETLKYNKPSNSRSISLYGKIYENEKDAQNNNPHMKQIRHKCYSQSILYKDIFFIDAQKDLMNLILPHDSIKFTITYKGKTYKKCKEICSDLNIDKDELLSMLRSGEATIIED